MMKSTFALAATLVLLPLAAAGQTTGCWDFWEFSTAVLANGEVGPVSLLVVPDGTGDPLTAARRLDGSVVDATVTLTLHDCNDVPIIGYPAEDLWLESGDNGLVVCVGGSMPDSNTDAAGVTTWSGPLRAGGQSEAACKIFISGQPLFPASSFDFRFNSPDINGDLVVNLTDVALFASGFFGAYQTRLDFHRDGVINLSDLVPMTQAIGSACP